MITTTTPFRWKDALHQGFQQMFPASGALGDHMTDPCPLHLTMQCFDTAEAFRDGLQHAKTDHALGECHIALPVLQVLHHKNKRQILTASVRPECTWRDKWGRRKSPPKWFQKDLHRVLLAVLRQNMIHRRVTTDTVVLLPNSTGRGAVRLTHLHELQPLGRSTRPRVGMITQLTYTGALFTPQDPLYILHHRTGANEHPELMDTHTAPLPPPAKGKIWYWGGHPQSASVFRTGSHATTCGWRQMKRARLHVPWGQRIQERCTHTAKIEQAILDLIIALVDQGHSLLPMHPDHIYIVDVGTDNERVILCDIDQKGQKRKHIQKKDTGEPSRTEITAHLLPLTSRLSPPVSSSPLVSYLFL